MKKKVMTIAAFFLVFAVGFWAGRFYTTEEMAQKRTIDNIAKFAQEMGEGLKEMNELLEQGPRPTRETE